MSKLCLALFGFLALSAEDGRFAANADRVLVNALVLDRDERLVHDLDAKDFRLTVDRKETPIESFWQEDGPVSAVILFDASGSMRPVLARAHDALRSFFQLAHPADEYALVLCKERATLAVPFTTDRSAVASSPELAVAKGSTPLYDALMLAADTLRQARQKRKVILVISDGEDTSSRRRANELKSRILEADAYVYAIELWTGRRMADEFLPDPLAELTDLTGGLYFADVESKRLPELIAKIDVHRQYMMSFRPRQSRQDGKFHRIGVSLRKSGGRGRMRVFWRRGYQDSAVAATQ